MPFLPVTKEETQGQLDFVLVSADAYVDHPSFGHAVIARVLEDAGYTVGIIAQPDWHKDGSFTRLGRPKYAFLVSTGNIDSMVCHYSVSKNRRKEDAYSPGGKMGLRPDRPGIVYTKALKRIYPDVPVWIGGIEASLRRFAHYDYWDDAVRPSILMDSGADVLMYGMGERSIVELAAQAKTGKNGFVRGCCYLRDDLTGTKDCEILPSFEETVAYKSAYNRAFAQAYAWQNSPKSPVLVQPHGIRYLVQMPSALPLSPAELDHVYELPYMGEPHPMYTDGVPAIAEVKFSITAHRGCYGGCAFCALIFHQGRIIQNRSIESVVREAERLTQNPDFKGYIHDVGGPSANFHLPACKRQQFGDVCTHRQCMHPEPCPNINIDHGEWMEMLRQVKGLPGIKKVFVRSGLRFDYLLREKDRDVLDELVRDHISGQLKIAPEHVSDHVLACMGKPCAAEFDRFYHQYEASNRRQGMNQYLVPYFMSSHPGCRVQDAIELAVYLKKHGLKPKQVQDFYPTPGTLATCIYYTGIHPLTGEKMFVAKSPEQKAMQRALMQYYLPQNADLVRKALTIAHRQDLIGKGPDCLVWPSLAKTTKSDKPQGKRRENKGKKRR